MSVNCPDHSEAESPWMCECTQKRIDRLKAENERLLGDIRQAIDELMNDDGDFVKAVGDLCALVGWAYPAANEKPTLTTVADLIWKAKAEAEAAAPALTNSRRVNEEVLDFMFRWMGLKVAGRKGILPDRKRPEKNPWVEPREKLLLPRTTSRS